MSIMYFTDFIIPDILLDRLSSCIPRERTFSHFLEFSISSYANGYSRHCVFPARIAISRLPKFSDMSIDMLSVVRDSRAYSRELIARHTRLQE